MARPAGAWRSEVDRAAATVDAFFLIGKIAGKPQRIAAIIQTDGEQFRALVLVIDAGVAFALRQVDPRAEAIVFPETLADIEVMTDAPFAVDVGGVTAQRHIAGAFWLQVDAAADAGTGRGHAVDEGIGAFEHFHAFQCIGGNDLPGQDAVQAVIGNIIAIEWQAANHEDLRLVGEARGLAHRGIVEQHIGNVFRLLVLDQLLGVGRRAEWHVHHVLIAQHAQLAAARDLTASIDRGQGVGGWGLGVDVDVVEHELFAVVFSGVGGNGQGT